jgi:WD40 repeat protein
MTDRTDDEAATPETEEEPEVYAIQRDGIGFALSRRAFVALPVAMGAVAGTAWASEKAPKDEKTDSPKGEKPKGGLLRADSCKGFRAHGLGIKCLAVAPNGKLLASGSSDKTVKLWSLPDGALQSTLRGHTSGVRAIAISSDGKLLASGGDDKTIRLCSLPHGKLVKLLDAIGAEIHGLAFSPDGRMLAVGLSDNTIKLRSLPEGTIQTTLAEHTNDVSAVAISQTGDRLVSGSRDRTVRIWSFPQGELLKTNEGHSAGILGIAISPNGSYALSASESGIRGWPLSDPRGDATYQLRTNSLHSIALSPDGSLLASGHQGEIKIWSLPQRSVVNTIRAHSGQVEAIVFSPDGKLLISGGTDQTIKIWSLPEGSAMGCLFDPSDSEKETKAISYRLHGPETITQACNLPIPPGMTCTCNCVAGSITYPGQRTICICDTVSVPVGQSLPAGAVCVCNTVNIKPSGRGETRQMRDGVCQCNTVCTCDTVCTCQSVCGCQSVGSGFGGHYWRPN